MNDNRTPKFLSSARLHGATLVAAGCVMAALGGCTTLGTGSGSTRANGAPVAFSWISKDGGTTGMMTATLPDGAAYNGPFVQITSATRVDMLDPMWYGWSPGWPGWRYWGGPFPVTAFATRYSGKVVANLQGPGNMRMRCRFHLNSSQEGMTGGGQGECQFGNGNVIDAVFARS